MTTRTERAGNLQDGQDAEPLRRAPKGGVVGVNGAFYEGGKFLPTRKDRDKRAPAPRPERAEQEARAAQVQARAAQVAAVAEEPNNARLARWLCETFSDVLVKRERDDGVWVNVPLRAPYERGRLPHVDAAIDTGYMRAERVWRSEFAASIWHQLTCEGLRASALSGRQVDVLARLYGDALGIERGRAGQQRALEAFRAAFPD